MAMLPHGEKISKISLFVLAQLTNVTDGRTLHDSKDRAYASHRAVIKCKKITTDGSVQYHSTLSEQIIRWQFLCIISRKLCESNH